MDIPQGALDRLAADQVVWLTTITDDGAPAPFPVWFVCDGDDILVFSAPNARRVHNIGQRPLVSLNFNSDEHGGNVWIISGKATLSASVSPAEAPGYVDKYQASIERDLQMTVEAVAGTYNTEIRITPTRVVTV